MYSFHVTNTLRPLLKAGAGQRIAEHDHTSCRRNTTGCWRFSPAPPAHGQERPRLPVSQDDGGGESEGCWPDAGTRTVVNGKAKAQDQAGVGGGSDSGGIFRSDRSPRSVVYFSLAAQAAELQVSRQRVCRRRGGIPDRAHPHWQITLPDRPCSPLVPSRSSHSTGQPIMRLDA
jgi:hypothetical protein